MGEVIQLPVQDKSGLKDDLSTAGIFWDECLYGRGKTITSQDFDRIDSNYPNDGCSQSFANQVPHKVHTCRFVSLSVSCTFIVQCLWLIAPVHGAHI